MATHVGDRLFNDAQGTCFDGGGKLQPFSWCDDGHLRTAAGGDRFLDRSDGAAIVENRWTEVIGEVPRWRPASALQVCCRIGRARVAGARERLDDGGAQAEPG